MEDGESQEEVRKTKLSIEDVERIMAGENGRDERRMVTKL